MFEIDKNDLRYIYRWNTIEENSKISGVIDCTLFDRREGNEVLYLINELARLWGIEEKSLYLKIEKMINILSPEPRTQESVKKWIEDNWMRY
ncbi:MAG: hypothetical protein RBT59_13415 [Arcobacteraceae bacterium]|jgi:hypothetical protein|nr:hypothetical protein [Arcobacteraceae bacterium]